MVCLFDGVVVVGKVIVVVVGMVMGGGGGDGDEGIRVAGVVSGWCLAG